MNIKNFPVSGYARFYRSLPRFYHGIGDAYAQKFTYALHLAINKTFRYKNPGIVITEYADEDFCALIKQANVKPYRTEVQLYRAMEALLHGIKIGEC